MAKKQLQRIPLGLVNSEGGLGVLVVSTLSLHSGTIFSTSRVVWLKGDWESSCLFTDWSKRIQTTKTRATQAAIDQQHASAFNAAAIDDLKADVLAFYATRGIVPQPEVLANA